MIDFPKMEIQQQYCQTTETTIISGIFGSITNRVGFFVVGSSRFPVSSRLNGQRVSPPNGRHGFLEAVQEVQMESQSWYAKASAVVEVKGWGLDGAHPAGRIRLRPG